jgi:hypothetical protein
MALATGGIALVSGLEGRAEEAGIEQGQVPLALRSTPN